MMVFPLSRRSGGGCGGDVLGITDFELRGKCHVGLYEMRQSPGVLER